MSNRNGHNYFVAPALRTADTQLKIEMNVWREAKLSQPVDEVDLVLISAIDKYNMEVEQAVSKPSDVKKPVQVLIPKPKADEGTIYVKHPSAKGSWVIKVYDGTATAMKFFSQQEAVKEMESEGWNDYAVYSCKSGKCLKKRTGVYSYKRGSIAEKIFNNTRFVKEPDEIHVSKKREDED